MKFILLSEAARKIGLCEQSTRQLADSGKLNVVRSGPRGVRLFDIQSVNSFAKARKKKK